MNKQTVTILTYDFFNAESGHYSRAQAAAHLARTGHELAGYYHETWPGIFTLVRTCGCK